MDGAFSPNRRFRPPLPEQTASCLSGSSAATRAASRSQNVELSRSSVESTQLLDDLVRGGGGAGRTGDISTLSGACPCPCLGDGDREVGMGLRGIPIWCPPTTRSALACTAAISPHASPGDGSEQAQTACCPSSVCGRVTRACKYGATHIGCDPERQAGDLRLLGPTMSGGHSADRADRADRAVPADTSHSTGDKASMYGQKRTS
jgi:hypothetical protein